MNILYVEDDEKAASAVMNLAASFGENVVWENNGTSGLSRAASQEFDVIILDRMLPDMDGLSVIKRLREAGVDVPVLMLSALARSENRIEGLEAGVDDYLAKPYEPQELLARIKALVRRSTNRSHSAIIIYGAFECHIKARTAFRDNVHIALSPKEFELFKYFMENAGEMVTRDMLLRDVWNMNFDPQTNVVDVNIGRLRRKLEDGFSRPALETIWGSGYRLTTGS
ncbi:DNA-binding response regulator [Sphingorhabdus lutea]|uniref:DNA-binding response regulator n=1 Tax=Sphingorhabdus lutea TaxID=1913578 RepID=A0A1L3J8W6_9SPHN|nr:response regulator transcription factor [Sphingorhabdus lutea]APG61558.1 DNA-binding response regulator [Sphingorhabdus lutea]